MSIQNAKVQRLHVETVHTVVWVAASQCCEHQFITYQKNIIQTKMNF